MWITIATVLLKCFHSSYYDLRSSVSYSLGLFVIHTDSLITFVLHHYHTTYNRFGQFVVVHDNILAVSRDLS